MSLDTWLLYVTTIFIVILIPGPLSLFMVTNSLSYGIKKTAPAFVGGVCASSLYLVASATGLGALIIASESLFSILKLIGALYLVYLGVTTWIAAKDAQGSELDIANAVQINKKAMFYKAFLLGASNPKDLLFFIAFLPQFISAQAPLFDQLVVVVSTWIVVDLICKLIYGSSANLLKPILTTAKNKMRFDKTIGGIFVAAGASAAMIK